jgi:hypothetical protein
VSIPLPFDTDDRDLRLEHTETALVIGFCYVARSRPGNLTDAGRLAKWQAASLLQLLMEHDPVGSDADTVLANAQLSLVNRGWDSARVRWWLDDCHTLALAHTEFERRQA